MRPSTDRVFARLGALKPEPEHHGFERIENVRSAKRVCVRPQNKKRYNAGMNVRRQIANRVWTFIALAVLTLTLSSAALAQSAAGDVKEEMETGLIATPQQRADKFLKEKDWAKLLAHARKWTREFPGESRAWQYLGQALLEQKNKSGAGDAFARAWALSDKQDFRIVEGLGDYYVTEKQFGKAEDAYRTALELRQQRAALWHKLAHVIFVGRREGWQSATAEALKQVLGFGQYVNDYDLWRRYAEILDVLGEDDDERYLAYRHVARLKVRDVDAWEKLYDIEIRRGNDEEVEKIAKILLSVNPQNAIANLHYGRKALAVRQDAKALDHFQIALASEQITGEQKSRIYMTMGDMHLQPADALPFYKNAISSDPANLAAWEQAVVMLKGMNRRAEAQTVYEHLLTVERKLKNNISPTQADAQILNGIQ